jgi:hypothetical protein
MLHWDPELLASLSRAPGGFQAAAWALMQTLLTEVLSKQEWLKAFDHVFTNDARFLYFLLLSAVLALKSRALAAESAQDLQTLFRRSHTLDINKVSCPVVTGPLLQCRVAAHQHLGLLRCI